MLDLLFADPIGRLTFAHTHPHAPGFALTNGMPLPSAADNAPNSSAPASQTRSHFLRQANGRPQTAQVFSGKVDLVKRRFGAISKRKRTRQPVHRPLRFQSPANLHPPSKPSTVPTMASVQTIIIGGGMAGLACAAHLERAQHDWLLFEAGRAPRRAGAHRRDRRLPSRPWIPGFFLTAYPEARALFDYEALQLSAFKPGARVRLGKHWSRVGDPLRRPSDLFATLFSRVGSLTDKMRVLGWKHRTAAASLDELLASPETSAAEALKRMGFSERMIESFWRPFFGGIFLESELRTSSRMLHFVFKMFGEGVAALPSGGIGRMPEVLAQSLPLNRLRLNTPVGRIADGAVELEQGGRVSAERIVLATDGGGRPCSLTRSTRAVISIA